MQVNRRKELFPNVSDEQWFDWKWQVKNRIETLEDLKKYPKEFLQIFNKILKV
jgi:lysine 2,3-aminomutase